MPLKRRYLSDLAINKIDAGEVVQSPVNIVKELIENAIDSEASSIGIEISEAGKNYISVKIIATARTKLIYWNAVICILHQN